MIKSKVGILGGTFNPIHLGHISIAKAAVKECGLNKVMLIPTGKSPHKKQQEIAPASDRLQMTYLATDGIPFLTVSDLEVKSHEVTYTVDTILQLKKMYPDTEFFYIIGADNIGYIKHWKDAKLLLDGLNIICISRKGYDMQREGRILEKEYGSKLFYIQTELIPISSSDIRRKLKNKEDVKPYLDKRVLEYIYQKGLYGV